MRFRRLGSSPLEVSTVGLGCMTMIGIYGASDDAEATATIHRAAELGGKVEASSHREFGYAEITPGDSNLFGGLSDQDGEPLPYAERPDVTGPGTA